MTGRERFDTRGNSPSMLQSAFIDKVLQEEGNEILDAQTRVINRFNLIDTRNLLSSRFAKTQNDTLTITFPHYLRQLDMKRNTTRAYPIYNRIVMGHFNQIAKRLRFGYTEEIRQQLAIELNIEISV